MAASEGLRRIERLGKLIAKWGALAGLLIWCAALFVRHSFGIVELGFGIVELVFLVGTPVLLGGMLRVITWVSAGFAEKPHSG